MPPAKTTKKRAPRQPKPKADVPKRRGAGSTTSRYDKDAVQRVVTFVLNLKHTKGEWAGEPFIFLDWQYDIVDHVFGTVKLNGARQYNTVFLEIPKKNGKSEFGAAVALYLGAADEENHPEIYSAAADRLQAGIVFDVAADMVKECPALDQRCRVIDSVKRIVFRNTGGFYRVLSSDVKTKHGLNTHGVIFDELHAQPNRELYDVLTEGSGDARRQPLYWLMTTAGFDRTSICWEVHEKARQVKEGIIENKTLYPVIYNLEEEEDWEDEANWYKVNPSLDHIIDIEKVRQAYQDAKQTPAKQNLFRRLRLDQWTNSDERWMPIDFWDKCDGQSDDLIGRECYAGLDLSSTTDLSALALVFPNDDTTYDVLMRFWIPEDRMVKVEEKGEAPYALWARQGFVTPTPGNVIDYGYIRATLRNDADLYGIQEIAFDRWGAALLVQQLTADGFTMVQFGQGFASMSSPTKELMTLVLGQRIRHGGNPVLKWNVDNLVVNQDPAGNLKPDKAKSTQKIDGAVALIMAIARASLHTNGDSVYEDRGLLVLQGVTDELRNPDQGLRVD